jgi:hypothetical protein
MDLTIDLAGFQGLERLPRYQNVEVYYNRFLSLNAELNYSFLLRSLGAVEEEQGWKWLLAGNANYVPGQVIPRIYGTLDYGFLLPVNHSSIWFRSGAGYGWGERNETLANFYFGGFGNNWIDYQAVSRYREYYSFPGVELNAIGGTNFAKGILEWTIPPLRFRRWGIPSFYLRWARLALFSSGLITNLDSDQYRENAANMGAQIDFRLVTFSHLNSTFSIGYAVAFRKNQNPSNEFMITLKIL